jgi:hypothetical protein
VGSTDRKYLIIFPTYLTRVEDSNVFNKGRGFDQSNVIATGGALQILIEINGDGSR